MAIYKFLKRNQSFFSVDLYKVFFSEFLEVFVWYIFIWGIKWQQINKKKNTHFLSLFYFLLNFYEILRKLENSIKCRWRWWWRDNKQLIIKFKENLCVSLLSLLFGKLTFRKNSTCLNTYKTFIYFSFYMRLCCWFLSAFNFFRGKSTKHIP